MFDGASLAYFFIGLVFLTTGAELLVRGATRIAARIGVSSLMIGLTVVAFGTGTPELVVSGVASWAGNSDIAVGNVIGSNIVNILLILGVCALVTPLAVHQQLIWRDVPVLIIASVGVWLLSLWGALGPLEGALLLLGLVWYFSHLVRGSNEDNQTNYQSGSLFWNGLFIALGIALLVVGSRWLVEGTVAMARLWGISELIISLTLVSLGTSLPEIATSIMAVFKGEKDLAVGNVIGSSLFNLLAVLGTAAVLAPEGLLVANAALYFDFPVMTAVAIACLPIFFTKHTIYRWEGAIFLGYYGAYITYLYLRAQQHDALVAFTQVMLAFVIPLTLITLGIGVVRFLRQRGRKGEH